jgi:sec-independent protein translocase protein TatA
MFLSLLPNLGTTELIVILVVALLMFGGRLPEVARSMGRSLTQFKKGLRDIEDDVDDASRTQSRSPSTQLPPPPPVDPSNLQASPEASRAPVNKDPSGS